MKTDCPFLSKMFYTWAVLTCLTSTIFAMYVTSGRSVEFMFGFSASVIGIALFVNAAIQASFFCVIGAGYHHLMESTFIQSELYDCVYKEIKSRNEKKAAHTSLPKVSIDEEQRRYFKSIGIETD